MGDFDCINADSAVLARSKAKQKQTNKQNKKQTNKTKQTNKQKTNKKTNKNKNKNKTKKKQKQKKKKKKHPLSPFSWSGLQHHNYFVIMLPLFGEVMGKNKQCKAYKKLLFGHFMLKSSNLVYF